MAIQKTKDEVIQDLAVERDSALKALADKQAELSDYQKAYEQNKNDLEGWAAAEKASALAEIAKARAAVPCPESPISVNWNMLGKHGEVFQMTLRNGITGELIVEVMKARSEFLDLALKGGYSFPAKLGPAPSAALRQAQDTDNKAVSILKDAGAPAVVVAAAKAATADQAQVIVVHAVYMEVEPKADGRVNVNWFGNDKKQPRNQFADIYTSRTPDGLAQAMPFFAAEMWTKPGSYSCKLAVGYTLSEKLNSKGNPYRDIQYIRQEA